MRVVHGPDTLEESITSASKEAQSAFGNGSIFLEKYVVWMCDCKHHLPKPRFLSRPKHLEVQVLGDGMGNVVHLFERDCTIQRKYQKIIEMAPAPSINHQMRASILEAAVRLAKHVKYGKHTPLRSVTLADSPENAGTVEFLVEGDKFYFIEMNPRM